LHPSFPQGTAENVSLLKVSPFAQLFIIDLGLAKMADFLQTKQQVGLTVLWVRTPAAFGPLVSSKRLPYSVVLFIMWLRVWGTKQQPSNMSVWSQYFQV